MKLPDPVQSSLKTLSALDSAISLLNWDRQVNMPAGGGPARTEHVLRLSRMRHEHLTSDELKLAVEKAIPNSGGLERRALEVLQKEIQDAAALPVELIERKARVGSEAYDVWRKAKPAADFSMMRPYYEELFAIAKETSNHLGGGEHPYDPLIDSFEEGSTYAEAEATLGAIKTPSIELIREIRERGRPVETRFLVRDWDQSRLRSLMERVIHQIGFDGNRGRLDLAANAFCAGTGPTDLRMTTRPSEHFRGVASSTLHEMGHGLYEQGQRLDWEGNPLCGGVSLAVHESQSRTWENVIGRSRPFWQFFYPWVQAEFPHLQPVGLDEFVAAYSAVGQTPIRVGSDELSYNLHILIRFEIESAIISNDLDVRDMPEAWNQKYRDYLGISVPHDGEGCLQDVHWSRGMIGYFPTYSFGNLIGVMIWDRLRIDVPNTDELMATGNFSPILEWLQVNVYQKGRSVPPKRLVLELCGSEMTAEPWLAYATAKFRKIYGLG